MLQKFISTLIKFLIIAVSSYILIVIIWGHVAPDSLKINIQEPTSGYMKDRIDEIQEYDDVDILFIGASNVYRGIDPRIFENHGITIFNLGSNSQTPEQTLILLKQYLGSLDPKLVVMDVYPSNFEKDGVESMLDVITNSKVDKDVIKYVLKNPNIKLINALIYKAGKQILSLKDSDQTGERNTAKSEYVSGGYAEYYASENNYIKTFPEAEWELQMKQLEAFNCIIDLLTASEYPFFLMRTPLANYKYSSFNNNPEVDSIFSEYGEFYNFQNHVKLSDTLDFLDGTHLSQSGVHKFNDALIKYLKDKNFITGSK
ncbi:hypothetical protein [Christiangramia salexigens]|uniref:SGNH hydrolase-type esterase domain-containing protein n=1 Tax=Christiangramia salexigens TaxID=1913577 RepID=A0A1L3J2B9_9FLAO|nr:hypothetical protein [Christiangramia salexigens]APG59282.1 hypothetical protein LPB144_02140 [Christiangramia salexigens]